MDPCNKLYIAKTEEALAQRSIRLMRLNREENAPTLSFSGIAQEKLSEGVRIISEVLKNH